MNNIDNELYDNEKGRAAMDGEGCGRESMGMMRRRLWIFAPS